MATFEVATFRLATFWGPAGRRSHRNVTRRHLKTALYFKKRWRARRRCWPTKCLLTFTLIDPYACYWILLALRSKRLPEKFLPFLVWGQHTTGKSREGLRHEVAVQRNPTPVSLFSLFVLVCARAKWNAQQLVLGTAGLSLVCRSSDMAGLPPW